MEGDHGGTTMEGQLWRGDYGGATMEGDYGGQLWRAIMEVTMEG